MSPVEILKVAKARIADPAQWCQGAMSMDSAGELVDPWHPRACVWCAAGSIWSVIGENGTFPVALHLAAIERGYPGAQLLNDMTSHADAVRMFDRAIAIAEAAS